MIQFMVDTNICIYALSGRHQDVAEMFGKHAGLICISSVTLAELEYGVSHSSRPAQNRASVDRFLVELDVVPFDASAAVAYGDIKHRLFAAGTPIGPLDMLIAAHARSLDFTLVTNNRREFDRIPGLRLEKWV